MDDLEKVERLRERADVSYEEAKKALEECNGDLLDAMVYLEKQGKVKKPGKTSYTTQYEEPVDFGDMTKEEKNSGVVNSKRQPYEFQSRPERKEYHKYSGDGVCSACIAVLLGYSLGYGNRIVS